MKNFDGYDGYTPSKRSPEQEAIDQETDGQTFCRVMKTYGRELVATAAGLSLAGVVIAIYEIFII